MIARICISINNRCNLNCSYCHFHEKGDIKDRSMDIYEILKNVKSYVKHTFKIGFVGNGEPLLDLPLLKSYIRYIGDNKRIHSYTITNGTVPLSGEDIAFFEKYCMKIGYSLDGYRDLHNKNRCNSFDVAMAHIEQYKRITGHYPTLNATVGRESLQNIQRVLKFFEQFETKITFSRMIGQYDGITLEEYKAFMLEAGKRLLVRTGGLDCTMYGGQCGAGVNNYFFANGKVYYCGNCIDLPSVADSGVSFWELERISLKFDRTYCYKELL